MRSNRLLSVAVLMITLPACTSRGPTPAPAGSEYSEYGGYGDYGYGAQEIQFLDQAPANTNDVVGLTDLTFTRTTGETTRIRDLAGPHGAVVVVTRGNTNPICPFCSTQTAHYIRDYAQFQQRGVEVLIVYPIAVQSDAAKLEAFLADARTRLGDPQRPIPFPVLFDVELTAVNQLGIRQDLSKPATYIVDAAGQVRYAYVGSHWGDRPAIGAVVHELDRLGIGTAAASVPTTTSADPSP